jgi:hypothetical protein
MIKIRFLNAVILLALIIAFSGCGEPTNTSKTTISTQPNQTTTQSTTSTTNSDIPRDIVVELDIVGDATYSLIGVGQVEATGIKKEIAITGNIYTLRNANVKVTMTAEYYDSSKVHIGTSKIEFVLYGAIELDYREFSIKFYENPPQVDYCMLTVSAYEGMS